MTKTERMGVSPAHINTNRDGQEITNITVCDGNTSAQNGISLSFEMGNYDSDISSSLSEGCPCDIVRPSPIFNVLYTVRFTIESLTSGSFVTRSMNCVFKTSRSSILSFSNCVLMAVCIKSETLRYFPDSIKSSICALVSDFTLMPMSSDVIPKHQIVLCFTKTKSTGGV